MREIELSNGLLAKVDDCDFERVQKYNWSALTGASGITYAMTSGYYMHTLILGSKTGLMVDHINHDGLDNRRMNLRHVTANQNQYGQRPQTGCTSKYKGVVWDKTRWQAKIQKEGKRHYLGRYDSEEDAARAYDRAAIEMFGTYAVLNFKVVA